MKQLTEAEFRDACITKTIRETSIARTNLGWILCTKLTFREGEFVIYTQRGHVRTWCSLDAILELLTKVSYPFNEITVRRTTLNLSTTPNEKPL